MRMRPLKLIAQREFKERTRSRTFRITMGLMIMVVVASVVFPVLASSIRQEPVISIGTVKGASNTFVTALRNIDESLGAKVTVRQFDNEDRAREALKANEIEFFADEGEAVYLAVEPPPGVQSMQYGRAQAIAATMKQVQILGEAGVESTSVIDALNNPSLPVRGLVSAPPRNSEDAAAAYPALVLLFVFLTLGGAFILNGVIEEKSSRVVEILLATVRPSELLVGKVIGVGAVGLVQGFVIVAATFLARSLTPGAAASGSLSVPVVIYAILWFVLGFALYSGMYACAGALVSRSEDAQNLVFPLQIPLLLSFIIAIGASFSGTNPVLEVMSFIPFTAPMTMLERMAAQEVRWWEVAVSISALLVTAALILRLATVIFAGGILRSGQRVKLADAWRNPAG